MSRRKERSPEGQRFGDTLRRLRNERDLSQERLAEAANLTADYVGFVERGENVPTLTVLLKLARALRVDASELLSEFTVATLKRMKL
ncbi:MAG TPA: helix-turn-helix transcriptional regulator [Gemmatimonadaceae bacterium]|nr:MAG: XRE family transcriptional regulator [Acidobacteriota bacterium]HTD84578.1 helix-turn-helix transcriptional regulator [Gemmatimonadaceae bacterium]